MPPRPSSLRAVRLDDLLALVGGDVDLLREVAELGASDVTRLLAAVGEADSPVLMRELAHELKGVLLNLTAASAASRAAAVEVIARSGDLAGARVELARSRGAIDEVIETLMSVAVESQRAAS